MLLTLRPRASAQRPACAALLRGADPAAWLREIGRWNLPARQLHCYLLPESIHSPRVAGLFVVADAPLPADVLEPYGAEAGRLYLPVEAGLWPATTPAELAGLLLYPRQVLHPSIGLVGFEETDELPLSSLLDGGEARPADWSRALPGPAPRPRLHQLRVLPPTATEVVSALQDEVGSIPLAELPGAPPDSRWRSWLERLHYNALRAVRWVVQRLRGQSRSANSQYREPSALWQKIRFLLVFVLLLVGFVGVAVALLMLVMGSFKSGAGIAILVVLALRFLNKLNEDAASDFRAPARPAVYRPGLLARLDSWLSGGMQNLEQQRNNEIERLLRLFADNPAEALKYAIPLGSPYLDRGTAAASARLGARATDFNLRGLGGGGAADRWDLSRYQLDLTRQYRAAAEQEAAAGRHQKAAYIYAHLLGDFPAAARVLEQGGYFREAAALYRDHLKNLPAAAQCLERGQLLLEAAELYEQLGQYEQAGDLYQQLNQPATATRYYERSLEILLANDDHLAAAKLLTYKLQDAERARRVLLSGWHADRQAEGCLIEYLDELADDPETDLGHHVREIFEQHTAREQYTKLLNVLVTFNKDCQDAALLAASRDVAYEVVSAEAAAGNLAPLAQLCHFQPTDRLLAGDCSRFASQRPAAPRAVSPAAPALALDPTIAWKAATAHRQQWVAVGLRDERLHLARGNWHGHIEYYSWTAPVSAETALTLVADERYSQRILLRSEHEIGLTTKELPKNKHFAEALSIEYPHWMPVWPIRAGFLPNGDVATADVHGDTIDVQVFSFKDGAKSLFHKQFEQGGFAERSWPCELIYRDDRAYTYAGNILIRWAREGNMTYWLDDEFKPVRQLAVSPYSASLQLAVATSVGLRIWAGTVSPGPLNYSDCEARVDLRFVGLRHLVVVDYHQAALYQIYNQGLELVRTIESEDGLLAVLPTSRARQFALLTTTGQLSFHSLDED